MGFGWTRSAPACIPRHSANINLARHGQHCWSCARASIGTANLDDRGHPEAAEKWLEVQCSAREVDAFASPCREQAPAAVVERRDPERRGHPAPLAAFRHLADSEHVRQQKLIPLVGVELAGAESCVDSVIEQRPAKDSKTLLTNAVRLMRE
jgi:hypothetical protein